MTTPFIKKYGRKWVVTPEITELDAASVRRFKEAMAEVVNTADQVVLNMEYVQFVDSCGLGALLGVRKVIEGRNGSVVLVGITEQVRTLFRLVKMEKVFTIHETLTDAGIIHDEDKETD